VSALQSNHLSSIVKPFDLLHHAPAWGATPCGIASAILRGFNPRARVGRDVKRQTTTPVIPFQSTRPRGARHDRRHYPILRSVSIHAPAWGATKRLECDSRTSRFNPRARVGRDCNSGDCNSGHWFQSTRPRGARRSLFHCMTLEPVSIHAPAWGATRPRLLVCDPAGFNPRARVGRDRS